MIRNQQVCRKYGAKLLINIHDELVYELPDDKVEGFVAESRAVCGESPQPDWNVPIKMEFKTGKSFGTLGMCRSGNSFGVELKVWATF